MLSLFLLSSTVSAFGDASQKHQPSSDAAARFGSNSGASTTSVGGLLLTDTNSGGQTPFVLPSSAAELQRLLGKAGHAGVGREYALAHDFVKTSISSVEKSKKLALETADEEKAEALAEQAKIFEASLQKLLHIFKSGLPDGNDVIFKALESDSDLKKYAADFEQKVTPQERAAKKQDYEDAVKAYASKIGANRGNFDAIFTALDANSINLSDVKEGDDNEAVLLGNITVSKSKAPKALDREAEELAAKRAVLKEYRDLAGTAEAQKLAQTKQAYEAIGGAVTTA